VTSASRTSSLQQICGQRKFPGILLRFDLLIFCVIGKTRLSSDLGGFVLVGRVGFALKIYEFDKVTEQEFVSHVY
jgi:hypothetical protein